MRITQAQQVWSTVTLWSSRQSASNAHEGIRHLQPLLLQTLQTTAIRCHNTAAAGHTSQSKGSIDAKEAAKFAQLASDWWHPQGPFKPLHRLNSARCKFIRDSVCAMQGLDDTVREPFQGLNVLDVGCGGGILSESMARLGANTHGIDVMPETVHAAAAHAALDTLIAKRVRYECTSLEALIEPLTSNATTEGGGPLASQGAKHPSLPPPYHVVLASEVIEHVKRPDAFMKVLATAVAPSGTLVVSTLSRTLPSWAVAILGAEYITGMVPRGTHEWHRFITPQELFLMADEAGLSLAHAAGMTLDPVTGRFSLTKDLTINYIAAFHKSSYPTNESA